MTMKLTAYVIAFLLSAHALDDMGFAQTNLPTAFLDTNDAARGMLVSAVLRKDSLGERDAFLIFFIRPGTSTRSEISIDPILSRVRSLDLKYHLHSFVLLHGEKLSLLDHYRKTQLGDRFPAFLDSSSLSSKLNISDLPFFALFDGSGNLHNMWSMVGLSEKSLSELDNSLMQFRAKINFTQAALPSPAEDAEEVMPMNPEVRGATLKTTIVLDEKPYPISTLQFAKIHSRRELLIAPDQSDFQLRIYDLKTGHCLQSTSIPLKLQRAFSSISDSDFIHYKSRGLVRAMTFSGVPSATGDSLYVLASLPEIYRKPRLDSKGKVRDSTLVIGVRASILVGVFDHANNLTFTDVIGLEAPFKHDSTTPLINLVFNIWRNESSAGFFIRCAKGFPLFPNNEGAHKIDTASFYGESPILINISPTGKIRNYIGSLASPYSTKLLGYNLLDVSLCQTGDILYYTQSLSDSVYRNGRPHFKVKTPSISALKQIEPSHSGMERLNWLNRTKHWTLDWISKLEGDSLLVVQKYYKNTSAADAKTQYRSTVIGSGAALQIYSNDGVLIREISVSMPSSSNLLQVLPSDENLFWLLSQENSTTVMRKYEVE